MCKSSILDNGGNTIAWRVSIGCHSWTHLPVVQATHTSSVFYIALFFFAVFTLTGGRCRSLAVYGPGGVSAVNVLYCGVLLGGYEIYPTGITVVIDYKKRHDLCRSFSI